MARSKLLEDFGQQASDELLKALLEVHDSSAEVSQDKKIAILVAKLEEIFEESLSAHHLR